MVVLSDTGKRIQIDLNVVSWSNPENDYHMTSKHVTIEEAKAEVATWWKHVVEVLS